MAAADTAKLVAQLTLDDRYTKGVGKAIGATDKLSAKLGKIGGIAQKGIGSAANNLGKLGLVAGGLVATQVYAGVQSLEDLERVTNATAAVIESTGGKAGVTAEQIRALAEQTENLTTVDDKAVQEAENLLLTFTGIGKGVFPDATKAVIDLGVAMADGDAANADFHASAIQVGKALNDPIKGVTALTKVGVSFTKAQKDQIKALVKAGKTQDAQRIILKELETEFGKAGAAAGTGFGADMRRFGDAVEGAQQALARGLLPVIQRVAGWLNKRLAEPGTLKAIEDFGNGLADAFDSVLAAAGKIPWDKIGDAMKLAGAGAKAALDFFVGLPSWVQTAVLTGWGLNKLTGGALTDIVGSLASGLIKGVLGINAGVVNVNAASVTGGGGLGPAGTALGGIGAVAGGTAAAGAAIITGAQFGAAELTKAIVAGITGSQSKGAAAGQVSIATASFAGPIDSLIRAIHGDFRSGAKVAEDNLTAEKEQATALAATNAALGIIGKDTKQTASSAAEAASQARPTAQGVDLVNQSIAGATAKSTTEATALLAAQQASKSAITSGTAQDAINAAQQRAKQDATTKAAAATAAAVRNKDTSFTLTNYVSVSTHVSAKNDLNAKNNYKSVYRVAI